MSTIVRILEERGLLEATTSDTFQEHTDKPILVYCGFDPTADSLHIGNMVPIMILAWFQRCGHIPYALMGGATGMIGDPSGRSNERNLLDEKTLQENQKGIEKNLKTILLEEEELPEPVFVNNYDWFKSFTLVAFLRDVGKYFRMGPMLAKESVRTRMVTEDGLSFTEFTYQVLQGYDFYYLYKNCGVTVQIGGSDQWGNITSGIELTRKITGETVYGCTFPLLTKSDGKKFGKSEQGAIWLSEEKLSSYAFYQYLFQTDDKDVIRLLKALTFIDMEKIRAVEENMQTKEYVPNTAQKLLAEEVTRIVHGEEGLKKALLATLQAQPGKVISLDKEVVESMLESLPVSVLTRQDVLLNKLLDVVVQAGFVPSKGDMRRRIENNGVWLNNILIEDDKKVVEQSDLIGGEYLVISLGKKNRFIIKVSE